LHKLVLVCDKPLALNIISKCDTYYTSEYDNLMHIKWILDELQSDTLSHILSIIGEGIATLSPQQISSIVDCHNNILNDEDSTSTESHTNDDIVMGRIIGVLIFAIFVFAIIGCAVLNKHTKTLADTRLALNNITQQLALTESEFLQYKLMVLSESISKHFRIHVADTHITITKNPLYLITNPNIGTSCKSVHWFALPNIYTITFKNLALYKNTVELDFERQLMQYFGRNNVIFDNCTWHCGQRVT
jgi:hypothetical protein